jgi:hypothetical protein
MFNLQYICKKYHNYLFLLRIVSWHYAQRLVVGNVGEFGAVKSSHVMSLLRAKCCISRINPNIFNHLLYNVI